MRESPLARRKRSAPKEIPFRVWTKRKLLKVFPQFSWMAAKASPKDPQRRDPRIGPGVSPQSMSRVPEPKSSLGQSRPGGGDGLHPVAFGVDLPFPHANDSLLNGRICPGIHGMFQEFRRRVGPELGHVRIRINHRVLKLSVHFFNFADIDILDGSPITV
jgi:hypothetical protein